MWAQQVSGENVRTNWSLKVVISGVGDTVYTFCFGLVVVAILVSLERASRVLTKSLSNKLLLLLEVRKF